MSEENTTLKLDYTIKEPAARVELVNKILASTDPNKLTPRYLEIMADYMIFAMDKQERAKKKILTDNHMVTVNKRETSFEGLIAKFENGEDGIYSMITNDKNIIFTPKISITPQDIEVVPGLKQLREAIEDLEKKLPQASGRQKYIIKKSIIEMRKDQYILKNSYYQPIHVTNLTRTFSYIPLIEEIQVEPNGSLNINGFSLLVPEHVSIVLCNYCKIKQDTWDRFDSDAHYVITDLENLIEKHIKDRYPMFYDLIIYKIDGMTNENIQATLENDYGVRHSVEYISSLWRKKIPKLIAEAAQRDWLEWHFTYEEYGKWKRCSRCGRIKLAHNMFFSKNNTSKDGFYSICKSCRNAKTNKNKQVKTINYKGVNWAR